MEASPSRINTVATALFWRIECADVADGGDELVEGSGADASEVGFQLGEGHFDR